MPVLSHRNTFKRSRTCDYSNPTVIFVTVFDIDSLYDVVGKRYDEVVITGDHVADGTLRAEIHERNAFRNKGMCCINQRFV